MTGAARPRGIGRATALELARGGADVGVVDIARPYDEAPAHGTATGDDLASLVAEIATLGVRVTTAVADVSDEAAVEAAVASSHRRAGHRQPGGQRRRAAAGRGSAWVPLLGVGADEFRRVLDVNVVGTWLVSKACATRMVAEGIGGRICNVSSQAGKRGFPFLGPYCAAKAGVILLTQTMALELGPAGIAVNAVCPGTVDTDLINKDAMFENLMGGPDGLAAYIAREIPLGRLQSAEEIAGAICWLLSDAARGRHRRGVERERRTDNGVAMPILDARHDLAHPVEGDSAWSESYYFNAYDPGTDSGLFSRIGIRPNEGTMDVGLSLWLPGGELGEYRWVKEQREMVDTVLEVGAVTYEMLEAVQSWRLTVEGEVQARPCVRGETATHPVPDRARRALRRPHAGHRHRRAAERRPALGRGGGGGGHGGQGASRAGGALDGLPHRGRRAPRVAAARSATVTAPGGRGAGAGRRCGAGSPSMSATACTSAASASAPRRATCTGAGSGTTAGPPRSPSGGCGRSWPTTGSRTAWCTSTWSTRRAAPIPSGATCCGWPTSAAPAAPWSTRGWRAGATRTRGGTRTGYGICEYLHQLDDAGRPVVPVA